jgi:hypothetical protein
LIKHRDSRGVGSARALLGLNVLVCALGGCTSSDPDPVSQSVRDAGPSIDSGPAGRDAGAGVDGQADGEVRDHDAATRDADIGDARASTTDRCAQDWSFLAAHQQCTLDADCVIVGACSGGFGFFAVQQSVRAEAQALSDHTLCPSYDGPLYHAVCEQGSCRARPTGASCGAVRPADGGTPGCPSNGELYRTDCDGGSDSAQPAVCATRCGGANDSSCGARAVCTQVRVSEAAGSYGGACGVTFPVWLCQPLARDGGTQ